MYKQSVYWYTGCHEVVVQVTEYLQYLGCNLKDIYNNKANSTNLYPPTKGYMRETCKSQNINPIYLLQYHSDNKYVLVLSSIKKILTSAQFQYLTFKPNLRGQDCV